MNSPAIPQDDLAEFASLPEAVKQEVREMFEMMKALRAKKNLQRACRDLAAQTGGRRGWSFARIRTRFYAWKKSNYDWRMLINRARAPEKARSLPAEFIEFWKSLCENNQRVSAAPWRELCRMWERREPIPGYEGHPNWPRLPRGWSQGNLYRHLPRKFELMVSRVGRSAAAAERPLVYTTRRNLWVGSHYLFDDIWHDHFVNCFDTRRAGRPLEFHALDLYSACKFAWGMRVRAETADGKMEHLKESEMRFLLAYVLGSFGYSPRGTILVVEHGTAAIREDLEQLLQTASGGLITVARSGMDGAAAHAGQYAGRAKGNFRFKAAIESIGNLIHNEMGALPGQTGRNRDTRPEELHGLLKHNDALLCALAQLPRERAALLQLPLLEFRQFLRIADEIYARINARTPHSLEGWDDHFITCPRTMTIRRKSPSEVWEPGKCDLIPLRPEAIALLLGPDLAIERKTRKGMFEFHESELSADPLRFEAHQLIEGEKYRTVLNPFQPDALWVFDARGRFVAQCPRLHAVCKSDVEAIHRACGHAAKIEAELLAPVRARHIHEARTKLDRHHNNASVLRGDPVTPQEKARALEIRDRIREVGAAAAEDLLTETPQSAETDQGISDTTATSESEDERLIDQILT
ncbi:MAG: hypothetical protein HY360_07540 [Verrucomicrobia bacterium]|nr:hypothetical protein [Verrucomicrobiota bacterium]